MSLPNKHNEETPCALRLSLAALFALGLFQTVMIPGFVLAQTKVGVADKEADKSIRINPGDVIAITVFPVEEYSREVTVQPDGKIEIPLIGSILVKGLSPRELQDLLQEKYSKYVANPQVTIAIRKFSGRRVAILGEVRNPGFYEYRDGMRLLELVSLAGGLGDAAKAAHVRILRYGGGPGVGTSLEVNFKAVLKGDLSRDPLMVPGDTIYVPKGRNTLGAEWTNRNILPWISVLTAISSIILLVHTNTGASK